MGEERTRLLTQEEMKKEEDRRESIRVVKQALAVGTVLIAVFLFVIFTYNEWYHPYPNQYRVVTNGDMYKIQEKNWFFPWQIYKEPDRYYGTRVPRYYDEEEALEAVKELEYREARRMRGKSPSPCDEWKPIKGE